MAVYVPRYHAAIEIIDDPLSQPADLEAYPDYRVYRISAAELRDSVGFSLLEQRMAHDAGVELPALTPRERAAREALTAFLDQALGIEEYAHAMGIPLDSGSAASTKRAPGSTNFRSSV